MQHREEAEKFYRDLAAQATKVRVGMEASGQARWFERLLGEFLVEAAQVTVRSDAEWRNKFVHLAMRRGRKIAKVAMARRLAVRLYWLWRQGWDYQQFMKLGPHAGKPGTGVGVQLNTE